MYGICWSYDMFGNVLLDAETVFPCIHMHEIVNKLIYKTYVWYMSVICHPYGLECDIQVLRPLRDFYEILTPP